jgi:hypothetical protein
MGGGGGGGQTAQQQATTQAQVKAQADASAAQLAEQQREFDTQQQQAAQTLANTQALQAAQQAEADRQAALTQQWQTGQAANLQKATDTVNNAFASFTPDYYSKYTKAYQDNYQPQIDRQYGQTSNQDVFQLARTGNLNSQAAANTFADLATQKGVAQANINDQAIAATTNLQNQVNASKQNLLGQATSQSVLGSPITPGSVDAITANFNNTANQLRQIGNTAGDTVTTLQATPTYGSLGQLFGSIAGAGAQAVTGANNYAAYQAFNNGYAGAASPYTSSGRTGV